MMTAFHVAMAMYLSGLAFLTMAAGREHYRSGLRLEAAISSGFTLVLAAFAALVLARAL
ncbi:MAG: hypothetical protein J0I54_17895 [Bosea sp.]|uniref:hypothetical protein n=1 Tax=unclassified Bosea (in: a-proteobacteria) TaxID=2653178 RepID=UPI000A7B3919|nr:MULTISPECIES: hypothetical protein [unclassified Bosea (in: a-proteobacteria)]MBN9458507.1 hypothetical protein [Bosea sp. (in: a-proteobacteria)]